MKKIATVASAAALAVASLSASAWWGAPYAPYGMTEDQQKAFQEQQQAMLEQQTKAMEQMMAAHRKIAEQMASQQAEFTKRMQEQGVDPVTMGFPGTLDPWGDMSMPEFPAFPEMTPFGQFPEPPAFPGMPAFGQMPEAPAMPEMPAFGDFPEPPVMPEMPAFGQVPEMPGMPAIPEMPIPYGMDVPMTHVPPHIQARYDAMQAQRNKAMEESKTRRDQAIKEMTERRKEMEANRFARPHRFARPFVPPYTMLAAAPEVTIPAPTAAPAIETPTAEATPAPAVEAAPTPAVDAAPEAPAAQAAPVVPAQAAAAPAPAAGTAETK